ncbi:septum formation family protein [Actinotalea sp. M2MS4P-6]|uniref:septum formation family protein n=1 Tax=Actinotalea sp. M2MS4P-6 TaxID=2983762 RepID=UPI0021E3F314|nr:septum formation family protein [Actinotalea sp. M2MS4P-6]MCV2395376.1 septum formation family protein [Actinotalea sp. M2MS4P-6]
MRHTVLSAALVLGAVSLGGCSAVSGLFSDEPQRDESGQVTEASTEGAFSLEVGDCFDSTGLTEYVEEIPFVPCGEEHDAEVYASTQLTGEEYPGEDVVSEQAWTYCEEEFASFVGVTYEESVIDMFPMYPVEDGWNDLGDREVLCIASDIDGVTSTLRDAGR